MRLYFYRLFCPIVAAASFLLGCNKCSSSDSQEASADSASSPLDICRQDPRVTLGLVPLDVCAGALLFFDEDFNGNGRSCGSCHPASNNYTLDRTEVMRLRQVQPAHPLFVANDPQFDLELLETDELTGPFALVKENVDGLEDPEFKYVSRAVSHVLSLRTSISRDTHDGTAASVTERTGWGGDGAPKSGSLRDFADGAIAQHLTRDMARVPGISFRYATETEKDQLLAFQLALGRSADIDLSRVRLSDARATEGQGAFTDPMRGRCNHCHGNAGANSIDWGLNQNFGTMTYGPLLAIPQADGSFLHDGGFGGRGLDKPNLATLSRQPDAYGDGTFNTPPLIEAADTGPYFHAHISGSDGTLDIEAAVAFYTTTMFARSPAAQSLDKLFGAPIKLGGLTGDNIGRFLRVLNAAFNLAIASQRLEAAQALREAPSSQGQELPDGLLQLTLEELQDALGVLKNAPGKDALHPVQQQQLRSAISELQALLRANETPPFGGLDQAVLRNALATTRKAWAALGSGLDFELGAGNLMF